MWFLKIIVLTVIVLDNVVSKEGSKIKKNIMIKI